jgi:xanthine dehydrogenase small subunit
MKISFICNDKEINTEIHPAITVLDFLRKNLFLTGTKEGCREGDCGACTVMVGELSGNEVKYKTVNSCLLPIGSVIGKHVVSIEGLNVQGLSPVQLAMVEEGGTQCGFCTPGFIISLSAYFLSNKAYSPEEAIEVLDGNICRCTGHTAIKRAAVRSVEFFNNHKGESLVSNGLLPSYFSEIPDRLKALIVKLNLMELTAMPLSTASGEEPIFLSRNGRTSINLILVLFMILALMKRYIYQVMNVS